MITIPSNAIMRSGDGVSEWQWRLYATISLSDHKNEKLSPTALCYARDAIACVTKEAISTLYSDLDKHIIQSFDFGGSVLTLSCSAVATTTPSLTRIIIPRICAIGNVRGRTRLRQRASWGTFSLTHPFTNSHQLPHHFYLLPLRYRIQICHTKRPTHTHHLPETVLPHQRQR